MAEITEDAIEFIIEEVFDVWQSVGMVEVMIRAHDPIGTVWVRPAQLEKEQDV